MIENLPLYIVVIFIMSTLGAVGIFQYAAKKAAFSSNTTKVLSVLLPFWIIFQATTAFLGFYKTADSIAPRIITFGVLPALLAIAALFIFSKDFILKLPLQTLTIIHIVRAPIAFVLEPLYQHGQIPQPPAFEGADFDILSGVSAPLILLLAFRGGKINKPVLLIWNLLALGSLLNVAARIFSAFPSPLQQAAFEQPNQAVVYFPFIWLPSVVAPIILFSHLASIRQILQKP